MCTVTGIHIVSCNTCIIDIIGNFPEYYLQQHILNSTFVTVIRGRNQSVTVSGEVGHWVSGIGGGQ